MIHRFSRRGNQDGFSLPELIAVLAIISLIASLAAGSLAGMRKTPNIDDRIMAARDSAARLGLPVSMVIDSADSTWRILLLPDGQAIGRGIDAFTGEPLNEGR